LSHSAGQFLGQIFLQYATDYFGRKLAFYIIWVVMVASIICESLATNWWTWLIAKLLAGIGVGAIQGTLPMYIAELAPTQLRGALINAYTL
jgi:MFS transporter, SP family, general alpha glucoside:H+ symporter